MAVKHKILYLSLAIACFLGIVLIFIFDGYMGVYDSLTITAGEQPQKLEADFWLQPYNQAWAGVAIDGRVSFHYEVDNRQFSGYTADVEVSVWQSQQKVLDLLTQTLSVDPFGRGELDWVLNASDIAPADVSLEQAYQFTMLIDRGGIERRVIIYVDGTLYGSKVVPIDPWR